MKSKYILSIAGVAVAVIGLALTSYFGRNDHTAPQNALTGTAPVNQAPGTDSPDVTPSSLVLAKGSAPVPVIRSGAVSFATTSTPHVSMVSGHPVAYSGLYSDSRITVGDKTFSSTPNQMGQFQRVYIDPNAKVAVQVAYPDGSPGDPVAVEVEDGGQLSNKKMGAVIKLDDQKTANFQFLAGDQEGIYRLVLRNGADVKTVNLWVGQDTASN